MGVSWAFVVLLVYPALQVPLLWVIVRYVGLRNDDGPRDPVGYSMSGGDGDRIDRGEWDAGSCTNCGAQNDPVSEYCGNCLSGL